MTINNQNYDSDLLRGNTDSLLLFLIDSLECTYGYQLIKEIRNRSRGFFRFKEGTVYPALHKLENEGLVKGKWQVLPTGQERRYYRITEKGSEALKDRMAMWRSFTTAMNLVFKPHSG